MYRYQKYQQSLKNLKHRHFKNFGSREVLETNDTSEPQLPPRKHTETTIKQHRSSLPMVPQDTVLANLKKDLEAFNHPKRSDSSFFGPPYKIVAKTKIPESIVPSKSKSILKSLFKGHLVPMSIGEAIHFTLFDQSTG